MDNLDKQEDFPTHLCYLAESITGLSVLIYSVRHINNEYIHF